MQGADSGSSDTRACTGHQLKKTMRAGWTALKRWMPQQPSQRLLSSKALGKLPAIQHSHPLVRDFADELSQSQPCFSLRPRDIKILAQPNEFLDELLVSDYAVSRQGSVTQIKSIGHDQTGSE